MILKTKYMTYIYVHEDLWKYVFFKWFVLHVLLENKAFPLFSLKHFTTNNTVFEIYPNMFLFR